MKFKYLILVSLILAILTIGAVSAAEDIDSLAADDDGSEINSLMNENDSPLSEGDDLGSDEWNENYPDDEYPINLYGLDHEVDEEPDDENEFAQVDLSSSAQGNISISVNDNVVINKQLDEFENRYHPNRYDDDSDDYITDESSYRYLFYIGDLDFAFEADTTYEFKVSYFDGENTYSSYENIHFYKKAIITQDGITIDLLNRGKCYIDYDEWFIQIIAPESADGNVAIVFDDGEKYSKTISLSELEKNYDEEDEAYVYEIYPKHIDSKFETGTYHVALTYTQDGIEPISLEGDVVFTTDNEEMDPYKGYINYEEINSNDDESVLVSVYCPEGTTGWFAVNFLDNEYNILRSVKHVITDDDYGNTISWNMSALGIDEVGNYKIEVKHYADDDDYGDEISGGTLKIVDETLFRVKIDEVSAIDTMDAVSVFCPQGSEGKKITLIVTKDGEVKTIDYTITSDDEDSYVGFSLNDFEIEDVGNYNVDVFIDDETFVNGQKLKVESPMWISNKIDIVYDEFGRVTVPLYLNDGKIILKIDGETCFEKYVSEFSQNSMVGDIENAPDYVIFSFEELNIDELSLGEHTFALSYVGDRNYTLVQTVQVSKSEKTSDDELGITITIYPYEDSGFAMILDSYYSGKGSISILINDEEYLSGNLSDYECDGEDGAIYGFYSHMFDKEVTGTVDVRIIYYLDGVEKLNVNNTVDFSKETEYEYSELTFTDTEMTFEEGSTGTIGYYVSGATVFMSDVEVEDHPEAVITLSDDKITVSGLSEGTYTLKVTTTPDEYYYPVTEYLTIIVTEKTITDQVNPEFSITIDNVEEGTPITVTVNAVDSFNGVLTVKIGENEVLVSVVNGVGTNNSDLVLPAADNYIATLDFEGDDEFNSDSVQTTFNVTAKQVVPVDPSLKLIIVNIEEGNPITVTVNAVDSFNGVLTVKIGENEVLVYVENGEGTNNTDLVLPAADNYIATLDFEGDDEFNSDSVQTTFNVTAKQVVPVDPSLKLIIVNVEEGNPVTIIVRTNATFNGDVNITSDVFNGTVSVVNGEGSRNITLPVGQYSFTAVFTATELFTASETTTEFNVTAKPVVPVDPNLELIIANVVNGTPVTVVVKTNASFTGSVAIVSDVYNGTVSVVNGEGSVNVTLPVGEYSFKAVFNATELFTASEKITKFNVTANSNGGSNGSDNSTPSGNGTNNTVPAKITAKDLKAFYTAVSYSVTVYGTDGKLAPKGTQVIFKINGKQVGVAKTNAKGVATIKLNQKPGNYKITSEALGANITKKLTVKHIITLKKVKVKRSAKKLVIKVTVKVGKKAVAKKKVTLKFKGKKYTAKTNKKGVAKFTIKKNVLKKLKKGKKVTYQATYLKDTVKQTVKVKK